MRISRRKFAQGTVVAGLLSARAGARNADTVTLRAISAARMPSSIELPTYLIEAAKARGARVLERRTYTAAVPIALFKEAGIVPLTAAGGDYLIPFRSLEDRRKIWDCFTSDPLWQCKRGGLQIREISLYSL